MTRATSAPRVLGDRPVSFRAGQFPQPASPATQQPSGGGGLPPAVGHMSNKPTPSPRTSGLAQSAPPTGRTRSSAPSFFAPSVADLSSRVRASTRGTPRPPQRRGGWSL